VKELQERAREAETRVATLESDLEAVDKGRALLSQYHSCLISAGVCVEDAAANIWHIFKQCVWWCGCCCWPCCAALADLEAEVKQHYAKYNKGAGKGLTSQDTQAEYQRIKAQVSNNISQDTACFTDSCF
jgi:hypothetical protein